MLETLYNPFLSKNLLVYCLRPNYLQNYTLPWRNLWFAHRNVNYTNYSGEDDKIYFISAPAKSLQVLEGSTAHLPCKIISDTRQEAPNIVLWFYNSSFTPFYTYDLLC